MVRTDLRAEPVQRRLKHLRIELLPIAGHQHVAGLVDQAHGVERARVNHLLRMLLHIADLVHAMRKLPALGQAAQHYVAGVGEQGSCEAVSLPCRARNVKFHHPIRTLLIMMTDRAGFVMARG